MANLGFNIKFDYTTNSNIKLDSVKYTKRDIKDNIINIFGLEKNSLNKFQTKLFESSALLEKHFNLRSYYKNTLDDKLSMNVQKAMLSESLKNRYLKIKMAIKFMNELGYNNNYDQFILAGASLGYNEGKTPVKKSCTEKACVCETSYWKPIFKNHIKLASDLHEISEIIRIRETVGCKAINVK